MNRQLFYPALLILSVCLICGGCQKDSSSPAPSDARTVFLGNWSVSETWTKLSYEVNIAADTTSKMGVLIYNFADVGYAYAPARALVSGNTITLDPNQVIGGGLTINGSGTLTGSSPVNWNYTISDGATLRHVVSIYTRR
jgi:hypothetical protein